MDVEESESRFGLSTPFDESIINQLFGIGEQRTRPSSIQNIFGRPEDAEDQINEEQEAAAQTEKLLADIKQMIGMKSDDFGGDDDDDEESQEEDQEPQGEDEEPLVEDEDYSDDLIDGVDDEYNDQQDLQDNSQNNGNSDPTARDEL